MLSLCLQLPSDTSSLVDSDHTQLDRTGLEGFPQDQDNNATQLPLVAFDLAWVNNLHHPAVPPYTGPEEIGG